MYLVDPRWLWLLGIVLTMLLAMRQAYVEALQPRVMGIICVIGIVSAHWLPELISVMSSMITGSTVVSGADGGGRGVFTAYVSSGLIVLLMFRMRKLTSLKYLDAVVPAVAAGYCVVRLGCFLNGDDFGIPTDILWAVSFPEGTQAYHTHWSRGWIAVDALQSVSVHPTQLYHALAGVAGFILLRAWQPRWHGSRLAMGLAFYGTTRFIVEFFRDDYLESGVSLDTAQWWSVAFIISAACLWSWHRIQLWRLATSSVG